MSSKKITLKSSDGETFEVDEKVAMESQTIRHMIEDDCTGDEIPLPNVTGKTLAKVIEFCKKHTAEASDLEGWNAEFVKVDQNTLFELVLAANFLNIRSLLDVTCQAVADNIKDKSVEEIRQIFNVKNDFTPEEEAAVRKENKWAFE